MDQKTTEELMDILKDSHSLKDLESYTELLDEIQTFDTFADYYNHLIKEKNVIMADVIHSSLIQRNYCYQIVNGSKNPSRNKVIALCLAAGCTLDETQRALKLAGQSALYAKIRRDSILIFAIEKELSVFNTNELLDEMKEDILS